MVPVAVPDVPVELVHVTAVTPTLSDAKPWNVMLLALVESIVDAGFVISSEGGVVLPDELGDDGVDGEVGVVGAVGVCCDCSVTVIVCVTIWLAASNAVIVMLLAPRPSGTAAIVQFVEPMALPTWPFVVLQAICTGLTPPEVVPEIETEDAVVVDVAAGLCTVSVKFAGGGAGCAGVEPGAAP